MPVITIFERCFTACNHWLEMNAVPTFARFLNFTTSRKYLLRDPRNLSNEYYWHIHYVCLTAIAQTGGLTLLRHNLSCKFTFLKCEKWSCCAMIDWARLRPYQNKTRCLPDQSLFKKENCKNCETPTCAQTPRQVGESYRPIVSRSWTPREAKRWIRADNQKQLSGSTSFSQSAEFY